ncbi:MAG: UDP-3-O-(3-hydroxymyristoyl)glucosamine N-acyltransferase [Rhodobacteraceae bacterium]|nr:UDP-3-O-(3-hydroxymyristoyl)glucosamine N-acyltransferase [Paracoccaceae bacterium]
MTVTISALAEELGLTAAGDLSLTVVGAAEPAAAGSDQLALAMDPAYGGKIAEGCAQAAVVWMDADWRALGLKAALFAPRARLALAGVTRRFDRPPEVGPGIHPTAIIGHDAEIGTDAAIGPYVIIGVRARIGANAVITGHCMIGEDATLGDNAFLHPGVKIGPRIRIGNGFISQAGTVIGADGFAYVTPEPGTVEEARASGTVTEGARHQGFERIFSIGSVNVGNDVELGANCTIDRGTVANTVIGDGTKIDNLVHVGHNVHIGRQCLLCGQVGIAGSATLGDRCVLGGQVGVADHVTVGSDVVVAGKSGISSNVPSGRVMMGNPAMRMDMNVRVYKALRRLPRTVAKLTRIEKAIFSGGENR